MKRKKNAETIVYSNTVLTAHSHFPIQFLIIYQEVKQTNISKHLSSLVVMIRRSLELDLYARVLLYLWDFPLLSLHFNINNRNSD